MAHETYQRDWKNTVIKVYCILEIVVSALAVIASVGAIVASHMVGDAGGQMVAEAGGSAVGVVAASGLGWIFLISGAISLVAGVLGVRGSSDPSKISPYIVFSIVSLLVSVTRVITSIISGAFVWTDLISIALGVALLILAVNVRAEYEAAA